MAWVVLVGGQLLDQQVSDALHALARVPEAAADLRDSGRRPRLRRSAPPSGPTSGRQLGQRFALGAEQRAESHDLEDELRKRNGSGRPLDEPLGTIDSILSLCHDDSILSYRDRAVQPTKEIHMAPTAANDVRPETDEIKPFASTFPNRPSTTLTSAWRAPAGLELLAPAGEAGVPAGYLKGLADYWATGYDWRAHEARLNEFPQFTTAIDGQNVHFLRVRSAEPAAMPLIITHEVAGSVAEFINIVGPLTDPASHGGDPADAFHVVAPSLPGFGFSTPLAGPGWDTSRVAQAWAELMHRLGYDRYAAQGGDTGSTVSPELGRVDPEHVIGVHVNNLGTFPSGDPAELAGLNEADQARLALLGTWGRDAGSYAILQSTRPQTLAYALTRFTGRPARLDHREVQGVDRPDRKPARRRRPRPDPHRCVAVLADRDGGFRGPHLLRGRSKLGPGAYAPRSQPRWRCSPATRPSDRWPNATTTSSSGPSSAAAATSPPWKPPTCWSATCGTSSVDSAEM